jgi:hypothetical protein
MSPNAAQPTTTTATPTHTPTARTPQPAPQPARTHDSRCCLSWDTAHRPATPTASSHRKPTPAPTTGNGHDTSKAQSTQGKCHWPPIPTPIPCSPNVTASPQHKQHGTAPVPHPPTQQYNHQPQPAHATLHLHHPHASSKLLAMVEYGWEWGVQQVGELLLEPLLLPPLPHTPSPARSGAR